MAPKPAQTKPKAKATAKILKRPANAQGALASCISKFRFQYLDCLPLSQLRPGSLYWDRISVSFPCTEVWQKVLQDARFSCEVESSQENGTVPRRRFLTLPEIQDRKHESRPLLNELAVFIYKNVSDECRRQWAATQYWRARVKSFAMCHHGTDAPETLDESLDANAISAVEDLPDPSVMTKGSADPYYRRSADEEEDHYNSLRQSQRVTATQIPLVNTLRMCYAEIAAPKGSLVLLRGQNQCRGQYVLAEYAEAPQHELDEWRLAEYDEPLSGYRVQVEGAADGEKQTRRVAYPWRRRKVRVICEIPKTVLQEKGSGSVNIQGGSSKLLLQEDVEMLRSYSKGAIRKRPAVCEQPSKRSVAKKPAGADNEAAARTNPTDAPLTSTHDEDAVTAKRKREEQKALIQQLAVNAQLVPKLALPPMPPLTAATKASCKRLYDLLEQVQFPKGCRSSISVAGFLPKNYLIFGLHRSARGTPNPNTLELTQPTRFAYGKISSDSALATRLRSPPGQYRELLEAVQKHIVEVGMRPVKPRAKRGLLDPVSGQFIGEEDIRFTSVMVAKNKRTYFHKDGNNRGPSYQVVITDPAKVDSGEFVDGNLLCWPGLSKEEADRRSQEVLYFHEGRRDEVRERREQRRKKRRELNPNNSRWKGNKDEVKDACDDHDSEISDEDFVLHDKEVDVRDYTDLKHEEDIEEVEEQGLDSKQVPTYDSDATVVECVNRYVSFAGRDIWHATQPWKATTADMAKRSANRYCITFFAVDLKDGDGATYKKALRDELVNMGFRPHD